MNTTPGGRTRMMMMMEEGAEVLLPFMFNWL